MKKITILGSGNMAAGLARLLVASGYEVTFGSRHPAQAAAKVKGALALAPAEAVRAADLVFLALPFEQVKTVAPLVGSLAGKIVVDLTNPLTSDYMGLTLGHSTSAGEQVQALFPKAKVVKAFNTVFAAVLAKAAAGATSLPTVLVAGNDKSANEAVADLARRLGFDAQDTGPLTNARYLEPMAELQIQLAYGKGHGGEVGFRFAPAA